MRINKLNLVNPYCKLLLLVMVFFSHAPTYFSQVPLQDEQYPSIGGPPPSAVRGYLTVRLPKVNYFPSVSIPYVDSKYLDLKEVISVKIIDRSLYLLANQAQVKGQDLKGNLAKRLRRHQQKVVFISANLSLPHDQLVEVLAASMQAGAVVVGFLGSSDDPGEAVWIQLTPVIARHVAESILSITPDGRYFYNNERVSIPSLRELLAKRKDMTGPAAILLNVDVNAALGYVWEVLKTCREMGIKEAYFLVDVYLPARPRAE